MEAITTLNVAELNPPLNVTVVVDEAGINKLAQFLSTVTEVGFDTETNIEDFYYHRRIRTVQIGNRDEQYVVDLLALVGDPWDLVAHQGDYGRRIVNGSLLHKLVLALKPYLENYKLVKVGHNLNFDYTVMKWCLGLRPYGFYDTYMAEQVIHTGAVPFFTKGFWALDDLCGRYLKKAINKENQKTFDLCTPLTPAQIEYAALDTRLPLAIRQSQLKILAKDGLARTAQIENDAIPAFADMHLNGLKMHTERWMGLVNEVKEKHIANLAELDKHFLPVVGRKGVPQVDLQSLEVKWRDEKDREQRAINRKQFEFARHAVKQAEKELPSFEGEAAINYGSDVQILEALRKAGFKKLKDTNDQSLKKLHGKPIIDALRAYRTTAKVLSTYGESFLADYIREETGRVHSEFRQLGAETGRSSSTKPNVQNILKGSEWRGCFISAPGCLFLTIDYNGCELRILAELSQDSIWLEAFKNGWDVHSVCAELLDKQKWLDATEVGCAYAASHQKCGCKGHKKLRGNIKSVNFGLAYGMEAKKLSEELGIPLEEAEELMKAYKGRFVVVTLYLTESGRSARIKFESRTIGGRRRLFKQPTWERARELVAAKTPKGQDVNEKWIGPKYNALLAGIEREGKNTPIQGTNADIIKLAMGCGYDPDGNPYAWHLIEPVYESKLVNMVHDELGIESPELKAQACYDAVADCMTRAGAEFVKSIPMTTDGHISDRWTKD